MSTVDFRPMRSLSWVRSLIQGYAADGKSAPPCDFDALAGCGAIRSTAADMLTCLEAQLHPDRLQAAALLTPPGKTLPAAIAKFSP